mgnify:CR=1 FL=1|tara:strand:- start:153 stop:704 length:552 start_codon:yes stop_codon:yes gene_type:complete
MKNIFILLALFGIASCEKVEEILQKGSFDGYAQCIKNNQEEVKLLGKSIVENECAKKYSRKADGGKVFSGCRAYISLGSKPSVSISECQNDSDKIITAVKVYITVKNFPDRKSSPTGFKLRSKSESIFIKPGNYLNKTIYTSNSSILEDKYILDLPYCSQETDPTKPCVSWSIDEHKYLNIDI